MRAMLWAERDVWLSETVDKASAEVLASWRLEDARGNPVALAGTRRDGQNGDQVTLTTRLTAPCGPVTHVLKPPGPGYLPPH